MVIVGGSAVGVARPVRVALYDWLGRAERDESTPKAPAALAPDRGRCLDRFEHLAGLSFFRRLVGRRHHRLAQVPRPRLQPGAGGSRLRGADPRPRRLRRSLRARPAGDQDDEERPAAGERLFGAVPRQARRGDRPARHSARRRGADRRDAGQLHQGAARHRGSPFLRSFRHRLPRPDARHDGQRPGWRRRPGRLDADAAARQEPVPHQRAQPRSQDQGGFSRFVARVALLQAADPLDVSRPRLHGRRQLRGGGGLRVLFRQEHPRRVAGRGGDARGPVQGAGEICAPHQPAGGPGAGQRSPDQHGPGELSDRGPGHRRAAPAGDGDRSLLDPLARLFPRLCLRGGAAPRPEERHQAA